MNSQPIKEQFSEENLDKYIEIGDSQSSETSNKGNILFKIFVSICLFFIVIGFYSTFFIDSFDKPKDVPMLDDPHISYLIEQIQLDETKLKEEKEMDIVLLLNYYKNYQDYRLKALADYISTKSCRDYEGCAAQAIYLFVRDSISYIPDPKEEYFENPLEVLISGAADCDGKSILLANLLQQIGIETRFILIKGHIYVNAYMPELPFTKKTEGNWIALDPTCKNCEFGEVPYSNVYNQREIII